MWEFLNQPLNPAASVGLGAFFLVVILAAIRLGHKKARDISRQFRAEHPEAATLYLYAEDLPGNDARVEILRGTFSKVFDPRTVPDAKIRQGAACHVLPGTVECSVTITWTKSYYAVRKHGSMEARFAFTAEPGRSYAAVFHVKDSKAGLVALDK